MISRTTVTGKYPVVILGDVVDFLDHIRKPVRESDRNPGPYPYYGANGQQGTIDQHIFDEALVLLAEDGGHFDDPDRGIAYRISGKTWVNNHAHVLRATELIDTNFLCHVLKNYDVTPFVTGTTRGKLTKSGASEIPIPLPPLAEQRRIAAILDHAEALRAKRREAVSRLNQQPFATFIEFFGEPVANKKGYPTDNLAAFCKEINDCPHTTPEWTDVGFICLRTSNLAAGGWNWEDTRYVSSETYHERSKRGYLDSGDIVLSREGTVGVAAIVGPGMRLCMGQRLVQVRPLESKLTPQFLLQYLLHVLAPNRISQLMVGSTAQHLNLKALRALRIPVPPLPLQQEFARQIAAIDRLKAAHQASLAKLDELFASLQHRAFRGELTGAGLAQAETAMV